MEAVIPLFDETRAILAECPKVAVTVLTNARKKPWTPRGFASAVEDARTAAKVATGKTLHDLRGTFATRLMHNGFEDLEIDEGRWLGNGQKRPHSARLYQPQSGGYLRN